MYQLPNISIKNIEDLPHEKIYEILNTNIVIEEKLDGVKVYLFRNNEPHSSDYRKNWIVSYKDEIIYPDEYKDWNDEQIKESSIGYSQFKFVHYRLKLIHEEFGCCVKKNTGYFCEFLMRKPSILIQYSEDKLYSLIGLGWFTVYQVQDYFGRVRVYNPSELSLDLESVIFSNLLDSPEDLSDWLFFARLKELDLLLVMKSKINDEKIEGVIINDAFGNTYKLMNPNQYNKEIRKAYRDSFKLPSPELEQQYWNSIYKLFTNLKRNLPETTEELNDFLSNLNPDYTLLYTKTSQQIKDDIYSVFKTHTIKQLQGNNNCLYIGKFRVFHNGHYGIIKDALGEYDNVCIGVVCKDTEEFYKRKGNIHRVFGNKRIFVFQLTTGNIITAMNKCGVNINAILCGEDRKEDYENQIKNQLGMKLDVYTRTWESSTKILEKIENKEDVSKFVPDMKQFVKSAKDCTNS